LGSDDDDLGPPPSPPRSMFAALPGTGAAGATAAATAVTCEVRRERALLVALEHRRPGHAPHTFRGASPFMVGRAK